MEYQPCHYTTQSWEQVENPCSRHRRSALTGYATKNHKGNIPPFVSSSFRTTFTICQAICLQFLHLAPPYPSKAMAKSIPVHKLNNGVEIPLLGFGTFAKGRVEGESYAAVTAALEAGYRHFDCAWR
jgi:hypothetical protein